MTLRERQSVHMGIRSCCKDKAAARSSDVIVTWSHELDEILRGTGLLIRPTTITEFWQSSSNAFEGDGPCQEGAYEDGDNEFRGKFESHVYQRRQGQFDVMWPNLSLQERHEIFRGEWTELPGPFASQVPMDALESVKCFKMSQETLRVIVRLHYEWLKLAQEILQKYQSLADLQKEHGREVQSTLAITEADVKELEQFLLMQWQ
ncbi:hypothetical protein BKA93DRAFT_752910 [Sparassis latifolia]